MIWRWWEDPDRRAEGEESLGREGDMFFAIRQTRNRHWASSEPLIQSPITSRYYIRFHVNVSMKAVTDGNTDRRTSFPFGPSQL